MVNLGVLCGIPLRKQMSMAQIRNQVGHIRFGVWQGTERVAHLLPPGERGEQIEDAIGQGFLQIAAFEDKQDAPLALLRSNTQQRAYNLGVACECKARGGEGIGPMGVESDGNEDEFGAEGGDLGANDFGKKPPVAVVADVGGHGNVQREAAPWTATRFVRRAGTRVEVKRQVEMTGDEQDGRVVVEYVLCAIAMMNVYVYDEDAAQTIDGLEVAGGNGDVVDETEAADLGFAGMMPRWTHNSQTIAAVAAHDVVGGGAATAGGEPGQVVAGFGDVRITADEAAAFAGHLAQGAQEARAMDADELFVRCRHGRHMRHPPPNPIGAQKIADRLCPFRVFRMIGPGVGEGGRINEASRQLLVHTIILPQFCRQRRMHETDISPKWLSAINLAEMCGQRLSWTAAIHDSLAVSVRKKYEVVFGRLLRAHPSIKASLGN